MDKDNLLITRRLSEFFEKVVTAQPRGHAGVGTGTTHPPAHHALTHCLHSRLCDQSFQTNSLLHIRHSPATRVPLPLALSVAPGIDLVLGIPAVVGAGVMRAQDGVMIYLLHCLLPGSHHKFLQVVTSRQRSCHTLTWPQFQVVVPCKDRNTGWRSKRFDPSGPDRTRSGFVIQVRHPLAAETCRIFYEYPQP